MSIISIPGMFFAISVIGYWWR